MGLLRSGQDSSLAHAHAKFGKAAGFAAAGWIGRGSGPLISLLKRC